MCGIAKKITYFAKFLNNLRDSFSVDKFEQRFVYKAHYCLCIESVPINENSLFNIFDNFRALKHGPVEWDIYKNRDIIPGWKYDYVNGEGCFVYDETKTPVSDFIDPTFTEAYTGVLLLLRNEKYLHNTQALIDLTHFLPLWDYAYHKFGEEERLLTKNAYNRQREWEKYNQIRFES